ncbi:MAG: PD-(D/E)XK nuclease family protein [Devosia sp.]|uniref:PD-(D/E)XK nuclease family protein n=1 Tax=Devosia sp. TaxID=1871048 RepID=UPI0019F515F3|nr:PD-(D/E)XK nuclease family protein [Devosia sp.]MBF0680339.1 PD-(D/E)XK nuclease family protein [Devosia sp.]
MAEGARDLKEVDADLAIAQRVSNFLRDAAPHLKEAQSFSTYLPASSQLRVLLDKLAPALVNNRTHADGAADIWQIIGLGRDEVRTGRILTWLLDPRGSHGLGTAFLSSLWRHLPEQHRPFDIATARRARRETVPLSDKVSRIDIEIEGAEFLLFIELKISAAVGKGQLQKYDKLGQDKAHLTGNRRRALMLISPENPQDLPENCFHLSWTHVATAIEAVVRERRGANNISIGLAASFAEHLRRLKGRGRKKRVGPISRA